MNDCHATREIVAISAMTVYYLKTRILMDSKEVDFVHSQNAQSRLQKTLYQTINEDGLAKSPNEMTMAHIANWEQIEQRVKELEREAVERKRAEVRYG